MLADTPLNNVFEFIKNEIKKILVKNFGEPRATLSIGAKPRKTSSKIYYYKLENELEINAFLHIINNNMTKDDIFKFNDLISIYNKKDRYISKPCVRYSEGENGWKIEFYNKKELRYKKTAGNKIAAFIKLDTKPIAVLKEEDIDNLYGLFGRPNYIREDARRQTTDGMSYWINKYLFFNKHFRSFVIDLLKLIGEGNYIYRDAARTIEKTHCFLPEINQSKLFQCKKPNEIFDALNIDYKQLNINPNKKDINTFYIISKVIPYIHRFDYKTLMSISAEEMAQLIDMKILFNGMSDMESIAGFITNYYILKNSADQEMVRMYAGDYVEACFELGEPVRLNYDCNQLREKHNRMAKKLRRKALKKELPLPLITIPSRFDTLEQKIQANYPNMFKRMSTTKDLFNEGECQGNCVFSRRQRVRNDLASIYHWNYHNKDYTIQFSIDSNGRYQIDEIMARFNEPCGKEERKDIDRIVDEINRNVA